MEIQLFNSSQFGELRTTIQDNKIWFCLVDVCRALNLSNPRKVKSQLKGAGVTTSYGGVQTGIKSDGTPAMQQVELNFIDEPNLYRCIFQSRKKEAERFQDWVFNEVLPSIRETGGYIPVKEEETPEMIMARALRIAEQTIANHRQQLDIARGTIALQEKEIQTLSPKAEYTDKVLQSNSTLTTNQIALELGMTAIALNKFLSDAGIQYRQGNAWLLKSQYRDKGYSELKTYSYLDRDGKIQTRSQMVWTESGRMFIHSLKAEIYGN